MFFLHLPHALFSSYPGALCSSCIYRMRCFPLILVHYVLPASIAWAVFLLSWCIKFFLHPSHGLFSSYTGVLCSSCIYRMGCFPLILVHYVLPRIAYFPSLSLLQHLHSIGVINRLITTTNYEKHDSDEGSFPCPERYDAADL